MHTVTSGTEAEAKQQAPSPKHRVKSASLNAPKRSRSNMGILIWLLVAVKTPVPCELDPWLLIGYLR